MTVNSWPRGPGSTFFRGLPSVRRLGGLDTLVSYARKYGDFVPLRGWPFRTVLLNHPDYVEEVLLIRQRDFGKSPSFRNRRRLLGNGLSSSEGDLWRRQRQLAQPAFHRDRLATYGDVAVACAEQLAESWRDGEVLDLHAALSDLTQRVVGRTLFGIAPPAGGLDVGAAIAATIGRASPLVSRLLNQSHDGIYIPCRVIPS